MKILHVVPTYWPAVRYGGPIHSVHALCRGLVERGHDVDVFTTNVDGEGVLDVAPGVATDVDGVRVTYFATSAPRRVYRSPDMAAALEHHVREFDLVHLHSVFLWPTLAAARAAERARVPFVLSPRGMLSPDLIRGRGALRKSTWIRLFERRTLERAAFVHVTSELEARDLASLRLPHAGVEVIPNGVDAPEMASRPRGERATGGRIRLLYLGRLSWKKSLADAIDALARANERSASEGFELTLAGPDDEGLAAGLLERATRLGVADRVRHVGAVHGDAKHELLASADALVLPSRNENFGNVVLEALACRTPVICTDAVGAAELVRDAGAGVVCSPGPYALADALARFAATSPVERERMGAAGRALVEASYRWCDVARRMLAAYEGVVVRDRDRAVA